VAALLVQHVPRDRHQVRPLRLRRVVHLPSPAGRFPLARPRPLALDRLISHTDLHCPGYTGFWTVLGEVSEAR
jgi:hypothetical protein